MYLSKRGSIRGQSVNTQLGPLEDKLSELEMDKLVIQFKKGDNDARERIIKHHMRLVISVVSRYAVRFKAKSDEMVSVALLGLTQAVDNFKVRGKNNQITPYIITHVHSVISDYLCHDSVVRITRYQLRKMALEYDLTRENNVPEFLGLDFGTMKEVERLTQYSENHESRVEITEIIGKLDLTRFEAIVLKMKMDGESEADIARHLNTSRERIRLEKLKLAEKLRPYFFDTSSSTGS